MPLQKKHNAKRSYDVIIAGAGPAGSAAAAFLARSGVHVLLLDRARFPREKVCGDGITPQALYWLDKLGCIEQVLDASGTCITSCDLYINGLKSITGRFPGNTPYPRFMTILNRAVFDDILRLNAIKAGAVMLQEHAVTGIAVCADSVQVTVRTPGKETVCFAQVVIGADGASSLCGRMCGAEVTKMSRAISVRGYFAGVNSEPSSLRVYLDESYFPGYGWLFVDRNGLANAGLGCFSDPVFPHETPVRELFDRFCAQELGPVLSKAQQAGRISGGWAPLRCFWRRSADRMILIGDAAACIDPLNGGGIHGALESAALGSRVVRDALEKGDCSEAYLCNYDSLLEKYHGADYAVSNMITTYAKNRYASPLYLALLKRIAALARTNERFGEFAAGIFTGMIPQSAILSPQILMAVLPASHTDYTAALFANGITDIVSTGAGFARGCLGVARGALADPVQFYHWFSEWIRDSASVAQIMIR
jgi:geranylgeranyl reductase family protein